VSRVLLDTSAYSAFKAGNAEAAAVLGEADEIYVNAIVLGELLAGFVRGTRGDANHRELSEFLDSPRVNLIEIDEQTAERYAAVYSGLRKAGALIPTNDLWIAASAMQHGFRLLTADAHFLRVSQIIVDFLPTLRRD